MRDQQVERPGGTEEQGKGERLDFSVAEVCVCVCVSVCVRFKARDTSLSVSVFILETVKSIHDLAMSMT